MRSKKNRDVLRNKAALETPEEFPQNDRTEGTVSEAYTHMLSNHEEKIADLERRYDEMCNKVDDQRIEIGMLEAKIKYTKRQREALQSLVWRVWNHDNLTAQDVTESIEANLNVKGES